MSYRYQGQKWVVESFNPTTEKWEKLFTHGWVFNTALRILKNHVEYNQKRSSRTWRMRNPSTKDILMGDIL